MKNEILKELHSFADEKRAKSNTRFFKTGKGEYSQGDKFLGIKAGEIKSVVKKYRFELSLEDIKEFLDSPYHEERMFALFILVAQCKSKRFCDDKKREEIFNFYINNTKQINNWDLVDVSAPYTIGGYLADKKDRTILYTFAKSDDLWKKRISIVSTFTFLNMGQYQDTLDLADILLQDSHDLIHKAVGWAIRNVGQKDMNVMLEFLNPRYKSMPRTMLRYAIEKLDEPLRQKYLKGLI